MSHCWAWLLWAALSRRHWDVCSYVSLASGAAVLTGLLEKKHREREGAPPPPALLGDQCSSSGAAHLDPNLPNGLHWPHEPFLAPKLPRPLWGPFIVNGRGVVCDEDLQRWADVFRHRTQAQHAVSPNIPQDNCFSKTCFLPAAGSGHKRKGECCRVSALHPCRQSARVLPCC